MSKLYADPEAMVLMAERMKPGTHWAAYQNQEITPSNAGVLTFMQVGKGCTYEKAPSRHPDTAERIMWRFGLVGYVNMRTGEIGKLVLEIDEFLAVWENDPDNETGERYCERFEEEPYDTVMYLPVGMMRKINRSWIRPATEDEASSLERGDSPSGLGSFMGTRFEPCLVTRDAPAPIWAFATGHSRATRIVIDMMDWDLFFDSPR
jgi:hypothetical protein